MNWNQLLSGKRFGMEEYHERKHERTDFQRDYDRLIFSSPFRRLQNKTQVFPLPGSIFVHNRLTHSLEVSCVGRSLGNNVAKGLMLKYPDGSVNFPEIGSIVSAACLAHDMGNTMLIADGEMELHVEQKSAEELVCRVMRDCTLRSRKSVNVPNVSIDLPSVTEKDRMYIEWATENGVDFIAHSFVRSARDVEAVQAILDYFSAITPYYRNAV